jgi:hypothetical protein
VTDDAAMARWLKKSCWKKIKELGC